MPESSPDSTSLDARLRERLYLPFLIEAQNADGGWGYRPGGQSASEPTTVVLLAFLGISRAGDLTTSRPFDSSTTLLLESACAAAVDWLRKCQLPDGSWPPFAGQPRGSWVTAPASLALHTRGDSPHQVCRGLHWLAQAWPAEGTLWRRMAAQFSRRDPSVRQDPSLRGWSWTPGAASWVEPTAWAMIAFRSIPKELHPPAAAKRWRLGERMLYDRMCPGGGWNSGNPLVYGAAGVPRVGPTVWALLALQDSRNRWENCRSLEWLGQAYPRIQGPGSLAVAHLCLEIYGRSVSALEPSLSMLNSNNQFLGHTLAAAWAAIALSGPPRWLAQEIGK